MGFTPNYSIPYPEQIDPPDGAGQMKALAQQVDTKLKPIENRVSANEVILAGSVGLVKVAGVYQTGWAEQGPGIYGVRIGRLCLVGFCGKRTGANITALANGNISPDSPVFQITDTRFLCEPTMMHAWQPWMYSLGQAGASYLVNGDTWNLATFAPNAVIATNEAAFCTAIYYSKTV